MAKSVVDLQIVTEDLPAKLYDELVTRTSDFQSFHAKLARFVSGLPVRGAKCLVRVDSSTDGSVDKAGDGAAVTIAIASHGDLDTADTVTIGGTTLTWGTDMAIGAGAGQAAANLANAINADSTLSGLFVASVVTTTVTITAYAAPMVLKHLTIAVSDATAMTLSAGTFAHDSTDSSVGAAETRKYGVA